MSRLSRQPLLAARRLATRSSSAHIDSDSPSSSNPELLNSLFVSRTPQRWGFVTGLSLLVFCAVLFTYGHFRGGAPRHPSTTNTIVTAGLPEPGIISPITRNATDESQGNGNGGIVTERLGCREYAQGGQSCVYSGIMCVLVNKEQSEYVTQPHVFFVDDSHKNYIPVSGDKWCENRLGFGPGEWPPRKDLFAPRHSCMYARWRTYSSLIANMIRPVHVQWVDSLSFVAEDYEEKPSSYDYLMNNIWLLDTALWQETLDNSRTLGPTAQLPRLFPPPSHVFLSHSRAYFEELSDLNQFVFALIMRLDPKTLYHRQTSDDEKLLWARPLLDTYPELNEKLMFYQEQRMNTTYDLTCTRRLTVGPKLGDLGHPRVCEHLRVSGWRLCDIKEPKYTSVGSLFFARPPRKVVLLQRHEKGGIRNIEELTSSLKQAADKFRFEFEVRSMEQLKTAVEYVRLFSSIGVLVTPHGPHAMGGIWMPRHSAIVELFPPGYADMKFNLLAKSCKLWYYDLPTPIASDQRDVYQEKCRNKAGSIFDSCRGMKDSSIDAEVDKTVRTVLLALRRVGHEIGLAE